MWSKSRLLAYLDRVEPVIGKLSPFELLDVPPEANAVELSRAFGSRARDLHPDLYRKLLSDEDRLRLQKVYGRITAAYSELRTGGGKKTHSAEGRRRKPRVSEDTVRLLDPKAQSHYRRAQAAIRRGDKTSAVLALRMALAKHPESQFLQNALKKLTDS